MVKQQWSLLNRATILMSAHGWSLTNFLKTAKKLLGAFPWSPILRSPGSSQRFGCSASCSRLAVWEHISSVYLKFLYFVTTNITIIIITGIISWALAFAKSTALWKQCAQADWAPSLLTPTTELWLPKLGIRRYHQSKPEFWTPPELSDTRMVISVNLSFGNTASLWIQGGLGQPSLSPVKKRISRSS